MSPPNRINPGASLPGPGRRQWFRRRMLAWYRRNGRDLPWRRTSDPYHILVSEIMLQQTQVDRVLPKYHEWLERYPSLEALAAASEADVTGAWRPLGYNIRPRRLHAIARESVERYGGELPSDEATLLSFKGIGSYTAGAVMSFAFGQRAAILDTNVARVLFRVFVGRGEPKAHAMRRHLWDVSRSVLPMRHVFDFNQALMDFGATLCSARKPDCPGCPLRRGCAAYPFDPANELRPGAVPPRAPLTRPSSPWGKSGVAPRRATRPAGKARRPRIPAVLEGGATQPGGMRRPSNAARLAPRAARPRK